MTRATGSGDQVDGEIRQDGHDQQDDGKRRFDFDYPVGPAQLGSNGSNGLSAPVAR